MRESLRTELYMTALDCFLPTQLSTAYAHVQGRATTSTHSVNTYVAPGSQPIAEPSEYRSAGNSIERIIVVYSVCGVFHLGFGHHCPWGADLVDLNDTRCHRADMQIARQWVCDEAPSTCGIVAYWLSHFSPACLHIQNLTQK
jgi:hypothetical protein